MASCTYTPAMLKRRVTVQQVDRLPDGQGGYIEQWEDVTQLWASIEPLKGWELMQAQQLASPITHKIVVRYRAGLTTANRLVYQSRIFDIKEVLNLSENNQFLQLRCVEDGTISDSPADFYLFQDGVEKMFEDGLLFELQDSRSGATGSADFIFQDGAFFLYQDGINSFQM